MKRAEELRIGNYVTINNPTSWPQLKGKMLKVIGVEMITETLKMVSFPLSKIKVALEDENRNTYSQFSQFIEPIPLTEELLLGLGFEEQIGFTIFIGEKFSHSSAELLWNDKDKWYCYFRNFNSGGPDDFVLLRKDIKHLHQLQNLYWSLCGKELTLK